MQENNTVWAKLAAWRTKILNILVQGKLHEDNYPVIR